MMLKINSDATIVTIIKWINLSNMLNGGLYVARGAKINSISKTSHAVLHSSWGVSSVHLLLWPLTCTFPLPSSCPCPSLFHSLPLCI